jgi:hypothetical protein
VESDIETNAKPGQPSDKRAFTTGADEIVFGDRISTLRVEAPAAERVDEL